MSLNTEQTKSMARMCYDVGKLIFAATTLDAIVKAGSDNSLPKFMLGLAGFSCLMAIGLKIEKKLIDPHAQNKPKRRR